MADLNFTGNEGKYVAEVKVTADFNLHIEREGSGFWNVSVRTTEDGAYDSVKGASFNYADPVVDCDFTGVIYPKYIKIVSKVQPTKAVITSAGEVTEMGNSHTITITRHTGEAVTITYEEGMTWYEWCNSELNNTEFVCNGNSDSETIHYGDGSVELLVNADFAGDYPIYQQDTIKSTDVISQDIRYATYWYD